MFRPRMIPRVVASFFKQAFRMPLPMTEDIDVGRICTDLVVHKCLLFLSREWDSKLDCKRQYKDLMRHGQLSKCT